MLFSFLSFIFCEWMIIWEWTIRGYVKNQNRILRCRSSGLQLTVLIIQWLPIICVYFEITLVFLKLVKYMFSQFKGESYFAKKNWSWVARGADKVFKCETSNGNGKGYSCTISSDVEYLSVFPETFLLKKLLYDSS